MRRATNVAFAVERLSDDDRCDGGYPPEFKWIVKVKGVLMELPLWATQTRAQARDVVHLLVGEVQS